ncbi:MAG: hypothetical protein WBA99_05260 [Nodosilinea sp.]
MAGALLWSSPGHAQGYCYLINSDGQVINLNDLCLDDSDSQPVQTQPETFGVGEAAVEIQEGALPRVRSYTLTGPASVPGSGTDPASVSPVQPGDTEEVLNANPDTSTNPEEVNDATTGPRTEDNRLDIPVRDIETPQIPTPQTEIPQVTTPEVQDTTVNTTETLNRPANGTVIRGTNRMVVPLDQDGGE